MQEEDTQNKQLLELSRQILTLTKEVRSLADPGSQTGSSAASDRPPNEVPLGRIRKRCSEACRERATSDTSREATGYACFKNARR